MIRAGSVKICSLREVEYADAVIAAGADLFGLIFVPGVRRQISVERAKAIVEAVRARARGNAPLATGVFVDSPAVEIDEVALGVGLDVVQLHGKEPPALLADIALPAIKAIRPEPGERLDDLLARMETYASGRRPPVAFLVDGFAPGSPGGDGIAADWCVAARLAERFPVVLAGGLLPENVGEAIAAVRPLGVDVSSGVETAGIKDAAKISAFVRAAREAFAG